MAGRATASVVEVSAKDVGRWLGDLRRRKARARKKRQGGEKSPVHEVEPHCACVFSSAEILVSLSECPQQQFKPYAVVPCATRRPERRTFGRQSPAGIPGMQKAESR